VQYSANHEQGIGMRHTQWGLVFILLIVLLGPSVASAHGIVAGGSQIIEVDAGIHPVRIEAIVPTGAPTVLTLKILPKQDSDGERTIAVSARGSTGVSVPEQSFTTPFGAPLITVVDVPITSLGSWDIRITIDDARHAPGIIVLPVTILDTVVPLTTIPLFLGFAMLAVVLAVQVLWLTAPTWVLTVSRGLFVVALTLTLGLGSIVANPQLRLEWNTPLPGPLPFVTQTVTQTDTTIQFSLYDGSTGLPVDDLVPHHEAFMHTVCIDEMNNLFHHVHPARISAGQYQLERSLLKPGSYHCINEVERLMTGSQLLTSQIVIGGAVARGPAPGALAEPLNTAGYDVVVTAAEPIRVGIPVALTVELAKNGVPVAGLQPWLGMRGHLIVRSMDSPVYGHVHAVGGMDEAFQPMVQPGNAVSFVYAFPHAGKYRLWFQLMIDDTLLTIPIIVAVDEEGA
jgi:hypothetical protein